MRYETIEEIITYKVTVLTLSKKELGDLYDAMGMHTHQLSTCESRKEDYIRLCKLHDELRKCYKEA